VTGKWVRGGERPKPAPGTILQLRPFELHGTPYYAVSFRLDADPESGAREARLSADMIYRDPAPGDRVLIQSVLSVVDKIERADDS
jgi:hypothetical protein